MTVKIKKTEKGLQEAIGKLDNMFEGLNENAPGMDVMREMGKAVEQDIDTRFATGGYSTWKPLSPITIFKKGGRTQILVDTGNMRRSVGVSEISENMVKVTVPHGGKDRDPDVPIAHQTGNPYKSGNVPSVYSNLPQRKIVEKTHWLMNRLHPILKEWMGSLRS